MNDLKYHELQIRAGMTCAQASEFFDVNQTTVRRWIKGTSTVPKSVMLCLKSVISCVPVNAEEFRYPNKLVLAIEALTISIQRDPGYASTWHRNISQAILDSGVPPNEANEAAARFMYTAFQVDTLTGNEPFLGAKHA